MPGTIILANAPSDFLLNAVRIFNQRLSDRGCAPWAIVPDATDLDPATGNALILTLDPSLPAEGFSIAETLGKNIRLTGASAPALLYGLGKILRTGSFDGGDFAIGTWRGATAPAKPLRIAYFASHFYNFYHVAPVEKVAKYIEDLALYGYNYLAMWADKHHFESNDDPALAPFIARLHELYKTGKAVGMEPTVLTLMNEGYANTPEHLRATHPKRSFYGCEVCPSTQEGLDLVLKNHRDCIAWFADLEPKITSLWSYDQGGCACPQCAPWGCNGMLKTGEHVAPLYRQHFPGCQISFSTWLFDYHGEPEWQGLDDYINSGKSDWFDIILADSHTEFPVFPRRRGRFPGKALINFPEISMWGRSPWGGMGASPLLDRFARLWGQNCTISSGGMIYSEGIFEDINKVAYAAFYWNGNNAWEDIMREYCRYEYGSSSTEAFIALLRQLERNHSGKSALHWTPTPRPGYRKARFADIYFNPAGVPEYRGAEDAWRTTCSLDADLPDWARQAWRWRLLLLRARIDALLAANNGEPTPEVSIALDEIAAIYHTDPVRSTGAVSPMTEEWLKNHRPQ